MVPRHGTTFAREGSLIMAPHEHAQFVARDLAGFCMYAWKQMFPQVSDPRVDADILKAFSINVAGDRLYCHPSELGPGWYGEIDQKECREIEQTWWKRHCDRMASRIPSMVCHGHAPFDAMDKSLYVEESDYNYAKGKTTEYNMWNSSWTDKDSIIIDGEGSDLETDVGEVIDEVGQHSLVAMSNVVDEDVDENHSSDVGGRSNKKKKRKAELATQSGIFYCINLAVYFLMSLQASLPSVCIVIACDMVLLVRVSGFVFSFKCDVHWNFTSKCRLLFLKCQVGCRHHYIA